MYGYILTYPQALKEERLRSVFSPDGTLTSASAAPHCGVGKGRVNIQLQTSHRMNGKTGASGEKKKNISQMQLMP